MKFKDPLASLYYIGGVFPVHLAMMFFSGHIWFERITAKTCPDLTNLDVYYVYNDKFWMFVGHTTYIICFIARKCFFSKTTDKGIYIKTLFSYLGIVVYLMSYMYLQYLSFKDPKDTIKKFNDCIIANENEKEINLLNEF